LRYEFEVPDTQAGRDLITILERGDIDQSSFGFRVDKDGQRFEDIKEGDKMVTIRTISKVSRLLDVSPVTFPAYPDTVALTRSFDEYRQQKNISALELENEERARQIKLAELAN